MTDMSDPAERLSHPLCIAFDMDGTLVDSGPRDPEGGPKKLPVREEVAAWARQLRDEGHKIVIVTGRDWRWRGRTMKDLERIFGQPPEELEDITLELQERWEGWRLAVKRKAEALRRQGCHLIVGDQAHLDGGAAAEAGIGFIHVEEAIRRMRGSSDPLKIRSRPAKLDKLNQPPGQRGGRSGSRSPPRKRSPARPAN